jgi:hypothetical protein
LYGGIDPYQIFSALRFDNASKPGQMSLKTTFLPKNVP